MPFNSEFNLSGESGITFVGPITAKTYKSITEDIIGSTSEPIKASNKELYDTNTAQQLTAEQISELQDTGIAGKELVQEIVGNSSTFAQKTVYSQAKYIKKKEKKYIKKLFVYSPTVNTICQYYMDHEPAKIGYIRFDTLAFMLHVGDIRPGNSVTINDNISGLLLAAAAERMGGEGNIHYVYSDGKMELDILSKLNISSAQKKNITYTNMKILIDKTVQETTVTKIPSLLDIVLKAQEGNSQGLAIANTKYHPIDLIKVLWKFLAKSGAFVIYHQYLHVLTEAEAFIRENKLAVFTHLEELWLRKYQVLKDRTHPEMVNDHAAGGYVLYGYKVSEIFS